MTNTREQAEKLLADRLDSVEALERARDAETLAHEQYKQAQAATARAWSAASAAGWTDKELATLGFTRPATRRGGRRPTTTTTPRNPQ